ncbi:Domain of unknown function DUF4224 [uncultured Caudovirales phage]|uniref:DUF4224 domain-containing protein n=1 Tax=uncultured Caudovirales phage TaxID=2100421 RepID=A0A6J5LCZ7_9CAUD|nr:Domain of unknown function DUF4224 [uncultured Caudovirales phage]
MFLTKDELRQLTGVARKAGQIAQLRKMGIAFYINAIGEPIVTKTTVEGGTAKNDNVKPWSPRVLGS